MSTSTTTKPAKSILLAHHAWKIKTKSATQHHVLLFLAVVSNSSGVSWHSYESISAHTGLARATVCRALKFLRDELGVLSWERGHGNQHFSRANTYKLNPQTMATLAAENHSRKSTGDTQQLPSAESNPPSAESNPPSAEFNSASAKFNSGSAKSHGDTLRSHIEEAILEQTILKETRIEEGSKRDCISGSPAPSPEHQKLVTGATQRTQTVQDRVTPTPRPPAPPPQSPAWKRVNTLMPENAAELFTGLIKSAFPDVSDLPGNSKAEWASATQALYERGIRDYHIKGTLHGCLGLKKEFGPILEKGAAAFAREYEAIVRQLEMPMPTDFAFR